MTATQVSQPASGIKSQLDAEAAEKLEKVAESALPQPFATILKDIENKGFTLRAIEFETDAVGLKFVRAGVGLGFDFTLRDMTLRAPSSIFCRVSTIEGNNTTEAMVFLIIHLPW